MFVTCLYAIIDTHSGDVIFANAGHNLPYVRDDIGCDRAAGHGHAPGADARHGLRRAQHGSASGT